jgi:hypothetical protein
MIDRKVNRNRFFGHLRPCCRPRLRPSCRPRRRGYALLIVLMVILTTTAMAAVHQRHLSAALRVEQARIQSEAYAQGPLAVLAVAIDLLKTGDPPAPIDYSYLHTVGTTATLYRISYAVSGTQWTVTAEPDASAGLLTTLPASF